MNLLLEKVKNINESSLLLMGHIVAGYPDYSTSVEAARGICNGGASFLEVQFPFSDPNADGPVIEKACYHSINNGFNVEKGFEMVKELSSTTQTAIIIMTYANIVYKYGIENFINKAVESGATSLIVPDLPPEHDEGLREFAEKKGIGVIFIATPGADAQRIKYLSEISFGLLYTVSRRGITGNKTDISADTKEWYDFVQTNSSKPIALGFGIQNSDQVKQLRGQVPVVVAGSYFVNHITNLKDENIQESLSESVKKLMG